MVILELFLLENRFSRSYLGHAAALCHVEGSSYKQIYVFTYLASSQSRLDPLFHYRSTRFDALRLSVACTSHSLSGAEKRIN